MPRQHFQCIWAMHFPTRSGSKAFAGEVWQSEDGGPKKAPWPSEESGGKRSSLWPSEESAGKRSSHSPSEESAGRKSERESFSSCRSASFVSQLPKPAASEQMVMKASCTQNEMRATGSTHTHIHTHIILLLLPRLQSDSREPQAIQGPIYKGSLSSSKGSRLWPSH